MSCYSVSVKGLQGGKGKGDGPLRAERLITKVRRRPYLRLSNADILSLLTVLNRM